MESPVRSTAAEAEISLAGILNILWRRRWLLLLPPIAGFAAGILYGSIVTPLYRATATVRPGITAFRPEGGGAREWRLKDITRWFHGRMYRDGVAERMGIDSKDAPPIRADFIQRGLQNIQGGSVITLSCLDPDPERARTALDAGIDAFRGYADTDSFASSIDLTRRGLRIQIASRERQLEAIEARRLSKLKDLELTQTRLEQLRYEDDLSEQEVRRLQSVSTRMQHQLEELQEYEIDLAARLKELDAALKEATPSGGDSGSSVQGVRPNALINQNEVFRGLVTSAAAMRGKLYQAGVRRDSLQQQIDRQKIEVESERTEHERDRSMRAAELKRDVDRIQSSLDDGIPHERHTVQMEIRERQVQLAALTPIERIGPTLTSEGPVRPRKRRAILILTFAGLLGGFVSAFVWDYLSTNRGQIFQS